MGTQTESAMTALGSIVEKLIKDARSTLDNDRKASERQHAMVSQTAAQEIKRLKYQNAHLTELLDAERKNATLARDNLVKNISSLLVTFAEERDKSLREVVSVAQLSNGAAESGLEAFGRSYAASVSDGAARSKTWASSLDKAAVEGSQSKLTATEVRDSFLSEYIYTQSRFLEPSLRKHIDQRWSLQFALFDEHCNQGALGWHH